MYKVRKEEPKPATHMQSWSQRIKCDVWQAAEHFAMPLSAPWYPIDRPAEAGSVRHASDEPKL